MKKKGTLVLFLLLSIFINAYSQIDTIKTRYKFNFSAGYNFLVFRAIGAFVTPKAFPYFSGVYIEELPKIRRNDIQQYDPDFNICLTYSTSKNYNHRTGYIRKRIYKGDYYDFESSVFDRYYYSFTKTLPFGINNSKKEKKIPLYLGAGIAFENLKNNKEYFNGDAHGHIINKTKHNLSSYWFYIPCGFKKNHKRFSLDFGCELNLVVYSKGMYSYSTSEGHSLQGQGWQETRTSFYQNIDVTKFIIAPQIYINYGINFIKK